MSVQGEFGSVLLPAEIASEGFFLRMRTHMGRQISLRYESALAEITFVWLFPGMATFVYHHVTFLEDLLFTKSALVGRFPQMTLDMPPQSPLVLESHGAVGTLERPLGSVHQLMHPQGLLGAEFETANRALVGPAVLVRLLMLSEVLVHLERRGTHVAFVRFFNFNLLVGRRFR